MSLSAKALDPATLRSRLIDELGTDQVALDAQTLSDYSHDYGHVAEPHDPLAVVFARDSADVQLVVRLASELGVAVIARGAGTGVSGGVHATRDSIILSLERMDSILEIRAEDETAVVQPGVVNADLNAAVAGHGLMYAPDPASYKMSTIGGNIATNAGGLRCAKYGVTRDSVLALDIVLADGRLIHVGRNTFKGVAGYDLTSLFVGSEGTLGIVVGATVRLRYLSADQRSLCALFPALEDAAAGVLAIGRSRVQPAITEMLDAGTMQVLDAIHGTALARRGGAMLLLRTDGYGAAIEEDVIRSVLTELGAEVSAPGDAEAERLIEMRRNSRGDEQDDQFRAGEDIAVPRSRLVDYIHTLHEIAERHAVMVRVVCHAGDGNLHPTFWVDSGEGSAGIERLDGALDDSIRAALDAGGTITGEHGIGQYKRRWLAWELEPDVLGLQHRIKDLLDPKGILNPGKGI